MGKQLELGNSTIDVIKSSDEAREDSSSKQIMKDRYFLACILKEVVPEYKEVSERDIALKYIEEKTIRDDVPVSKNLTNQFPILGTSEEDLSVNEGTIRYDVIFEATAPVDVPVGKYKHKRKGSILKIKLKIDMEAQLKYDEGYPLSKRAIFYSARMFSSEFEGKTETINYKNLYKVYSIWICFEPPAYASNTITRFKITKEDVLGKIEIPEMDYNLMESVIIRLGKEDQAPKNKLFELLYTIFGENPGNEKVEQLQKLGYAGTSLEKEVIIMMTFSERTLKQGIKQGQLNMLDLMIKLRTMYEEGHSLSEISARSGIDEEQLKKIFGL